LVGEHAECLLFAAVAVNGKLQYAIVEVHSPLGDTAVPKEDKRCRLAKVMKGEKRPFLVVASDLVPALEVKWGVKLSVKKVLLGSDLENCRLLNDDVLNWILLILVL